MSLASNNLDEIQQQRGLEHPVEFHFVVQQQVLQASSGAELGHNGKHATVVEEAQEGVDVLVTHVFHLQTLLN